MNKLEKIVKSTTGETRQALDELVHALADSIRKNKMLEQQIDYMKEDNRLLKHKLFGSSSEKMKTDGPYYQYETFNEFELCAEIVELAAPPVTEEKSTSSKKRSGRKPLPKHLPRKVIEHDLTDEQKQCACGNTMECIGAQVSEELAYRPAQFTVIEHRCKKYGCATCNQANKKDPTVKAQLKTAAKLDSLIPKSMASASLLAAIIVSKFCDHLPLYRLEGILKRSSIDVSRQVMST
jgi:transposase